MQAILRNASEQADRTRAAIRRPLGVPARVFIAVVDRDGRTVLGVWRTREATLFSFDVAVQKARTALAFSDPDNVEFGQRIRTILGLPSLSVLAMTTRAVGFLAQDAYPPGIDRDGLDKPLGPGPLYSGPGFQYQRSLLRPGLPPYGNGITIFPGGIPLYRGGVLIGAIGVSGDGVDQDDLIAFAGTKGFEAPEAVRCDQFFFDGVRLPFIKLPRQPEL
ncbi:MAG: heme-binding protein [Ignavibacteria bacterium]|nr:heme-binding protein [Ignavibacteria bacterium]